MELQVDAMPMAPEFEVGPARLRRFTLALERKRDCMTRAGQAGYETHLAVVPWLLGSTAAWVQHLRAAPLGWEHPQNLWAVNVYQRAGVAPVDRIWPIPG